MVEEEITVRGPADVPAVGISRACDSPDDASVPASIRSTSAHALGAACTKRPPKKRETRSQSAPPSIA